MFEVLADVMEMENGENKTTVDVIVISDDEDSEDKHTLDVYRAEDNSLKNPVIVIEEDDTVNEATPAVEVSDCKKPGASSPVKRVYSPCGKYKISKDGLKELKAMVRLTKLDLKPGTKPFNIKSENKTTVDEDNDAACKDKESSACTASEARDLKLQVKTEKDDESKSGESQTTENTGIFELVEKKFNMTLSNSNGVNNHYQQLNSSNKRPKKKPPSSSSLKQGTLSAESFSPKKRPMLNSYPRQEQCLHYTTPLFCKVPLRKSELDGRSKEDGLSKCFTENQMNTIQSLREENFYESVLATINSFMHHRRKPPPDLLFYLLKNILLSKQSKCGTECIRILRQIQVLHPIVAMEMVRQKITWEFVSMVAKLSGCGQVHKAYSCLEVHASMALSFLVSVIEDEVNIKKFSLVKTSANRLLSVNNQSSHIHDVVEWIGQSLMHHKGERLDQNCGQNFCPLYLLQRMLTLSLLVSDRPEDSAARLADELVVVYVELQSIMHKTLLLQSVQSHLLKSKLIEVIVTNCCPLDGEQLNVEGISRAGLRRIVFTEFRRSPPANSSSIHGLDSDMSGNTVANTTNCEEFIMLLAYWLQSFVFCLKRTLTKNTMPDLSIDDIDVLNEIDEEVLMLRVRLESLCNPLPLSPRSYQLLELISSLKSFAPMVPKLTAELKPCLFSSC